MSVGTRGGKLVQFMAPRDGEYLIKSRLGRGLDEDIPHFLGDQHLEISVDSVRVQVFTLAATPGLPLNIERQVFGAEPKPRRGGLGTAAVGNQAAGDRQPAQAESSGQ